MKCSKETKDSTQEEPCGRNSGLDGATERDRAVRILTDAPPRGSAEVQNKAHYRGLSLYRHTSAHLVLIFKIFPFEMGRDHITHRISIFWLSFIVAVVPHQAQRKTLHNPLPLPSLARCCREQQGTRPAACVLLLARRDSRSSVLLSFPTG